MAQDEPRFSHISVSAGDDDDVVIVAGAAHAAASSSQAAPRASSKPEPASEPAREGVGAPDDAQRASASPKAEAPTASSRKAARDRYEETTLDDLQGAKMSTMQKAIIAVAVIGVVAFAVYYMFLR